MHLNEEFVMYKETKQHLYAIPKKSWGDIEHHGIKGQKWGVRNGPPYPLDSSKSTGSRLKETKGDIKKKKIFTGEANEKSWASKHNKTPKVESLKLDEYGWNKSSEVKVPREWGNVEVEFPNTHINFPKDVDQDTVDKAYKEMNSFIDDFNNNPKILDDIKEEIYREYGQSVWDNENGLPSKQEFKNRITSINSLGFWSSNRKNDMTQVFEDEVPLSAMIYFNDGGMFYDHVFTVEYDPLRRRVSYVAVEG